MIISTPIIKAVAATYDTVDALQQDLANAVQDMMANPDAIVSASTGAGASYSKQISMTAAERVELLSYALDYKQYGYVSTDGDNIHYSFTWLP